MREPGNADLPIGDEKKKPFRKSKIPPNPLGWHSRGYLPHFDGDGFTQHVTIHLADSLPQQVIKLMDERINAVDPENQDVERRKQIEAWLDAGYGSCILRDAAVAAMVQNALFYFDAERYRLIEWSIMPNHVHILFEPNNGWKMSQIVSSWKKFTASRIYEMARSGNATLLSGSIPRPVWHREYRDRYIRNQEHFENAVEYIRLNPVKAGLVAKPQDWRWSSAHDRIS